MVTLEEAEAELQTPVAQIHFDIARSLVVGMSPETVAEAYGFETAEVVEVTTEESFVRLRQFIAYKYHELSMDTDDALDTLENLSARNLVETVKMSRDPDFNLRVLAVANKAQRRNRRSAAQVLNPDNAGQRVVLRMSKRILDKMNGDRVVEETVEAKTELNLDMLKMPEPKAIGDTLGIEIKGLASQENDRCTEDTIESLDGLMISGVVDD